MVDLIVTGVDGSETAREAARTAARLAEGLGARLQVISAFGQFEVQRRTTEGRQFEIDQRRHAEEIVTQEAATLRTEFPQLDIADRAADGRPADALVDTAEELGADLIVVGNKRVQSLARVLGSIASDVAKKSPCDVYIAHTHQRD